MAINVRLDGFQLSQQELQRALDKFRVRKVVTVGIHEDAGNVSDGSETQAQNGARQNFGDPHNTLNGKPAPIPARPWLEPGVRSATPEILDVVSESIRNNESLENTLNKIGAFATGATQQYMTDLRNPPNAPYTIEKKGSDNPLIDTGSMRASVTWKIADQMPDEER